MKSKSKPEPRYSLELTQSQLDLVARALEDWSRFLCGQCEMWNATSMLDGFSEIKESLREIEPLVVPELVEQYGRGASYGWSGASCPNEYQRKAIAMSYGIYREILHQRTLERGVSNVYSSPTLTCDEQGPLVKVKRLPDE